MTVIYALMYRRQNKKLKDLEVDKARIESKNDEWHLYKEQLESAFNRIKELLEVNREKETRLVEKDRSYSESINAVEERFNKQTNYLRGIQRSLNESLEKINELICEKGKLLRLIDHLNQWKCIKPWVECKDREPEQTVKPIRYIPFKEIETEREKTLDKFEKEEA
ncbi:MAG: hypothetical protein J1D77_03650 [Muribaculaceae bacterium]|nr:hypothetical protein [Muribaculaceae bacterium]